MAFLILIFVLIAIGIFLFLGWILQKILIYFDIKHVTYKKSLLVVLGFSVLTFVFDIILYTFPLEILQPLLVAIFSFGIFYYLLKRGFSVEIKKSIRIYVVYLILSTIGIIVSALVLAIPVRTFVASPIVIRGDSMNPTYYNGDYIWINKLYPKLDRGSIVVYDVPNRLYISRIIGLPGEKVEIRDNVVYIDGQPLSNEPYVQGLTQENINIELSSHQYFMLGDNREHSTDSRTTGPISRDKIEGKVIEDIDPISMQ
jgi:signal peptidase I